MPSNPIGIDTGGTFTDFAWLDEDGRLRIHKQPSTHDDPARAIVTGLAASGVPDDAAVIHGSTVATNALLERRGARTALITTAGFRDVLEIGRQNRPDIYALVPQKPPPLVPRAWRFEAGERVTAAGEVLRPLDEAALAPVLESLAAERIESVAVCLLFSFLHPAHERRVGELVRAALGPGVHVSLSVDILPEYREFERTAATVINAYVAPLMSRYLTRLATAIAPRRLAVMQSSGGIISPATAGAQAARTALSGPAGGVVGAMFVSRYEIRDTRYEGSDELRVTNDELGEARYEIRDTRYEGSDELGEARYEIRDTRYEGSDEFRVTSDELRGSDELGRAGGGGSGVVGGSSVGYAKIITFDMGGTSTDVALCPGRVPMTTEGEIAGLPLRLPIVDIHTVGAGGGSLAWVDPGGALLVGPQSAGASPGPAAYHAGYPAWRAALDRHFTPGRATVSDANLVLGRLDAAHFLGGQMPLHEESARQALATLAAVMGAASPEAAAWAVVRVANANMERAVRRISVERGHDPRRFTLVAFGGGGPLHACELAAGLRIPRVLVPPTPGVLSALGMLVAEPARDFSRTVMLAPNDAERLAAEFALLEAAAREEMAAEGYPVGSLRMRRALDMRYLGQSHELTIPLPGTDPAAVAEAFHAAHERRYGYARPEATVEIVTARLTAVVATTAPAFPRAPLAGPDPTAALIGHKPVWFDDAFRNTPLYDRERLRPGNVLPGPGVVIQYDTTTIIPPGWSATVDGSNNLVIMSMETQQE